MRARRTPMGESKTPGKSRLKSHLPRIGRSNSWPKKKRTTKRAGNRRVVSLREGPAGHHPVSRRFGEVVQRAGQQRLHLRRPSRGEQDGDQGRRAAHLRSEGSEGEHDVAEGPG